MANALRTLIPAALLCAALPAGLAAQEDNPVLLEVAGESVHLDSILKNFEEQHQGHMSMLGDAAEVEALVERTLDYRLLVVGALSEGFGEHEDMVRMVDTFTRQLVGAKYTEARTLMGVSVEREAVEEFLDRLGTLYHLRELGTETRAAAEEAAAAIRASGDFNAACKKYSNLPSKLHNGSTTKRVDQMPAVLREWAVRADPGDVSPVVMTQQGYLVVYFERSEDMPPPEYATTDTRIMSILMQDGIAARRDELRDELRAKYNAELKVAIDPSWLRPGTEQPGDTVLATADAVDPVILEELWTAMTLPEEKLQDDALVLELAEYLAWRILDQDLVQEEAMRSHWVEDPEIQLEVANFRDRLLVNAVKMEVIYADLDPTEEELAELYEADQERWRLPDQVETRHILVETEEAALALKAEIDAGADFNEVATANTIDAATAPNGGYVGWVVPGKIHPSLDEVLFVLPVGDVSGPVESPVGWHILKVIRRTQGQPRPLSMVREKFLESVIDQRRAEAKAKWLKLLRERVEWTVRRDNFDRALEIIQARLESEAEAKAAGGASGHPAF